MEAKAKKRLPVPCSPPPSTAGDGSSSRARNSELELIDNQATDFKQLLRKVTCSS